MLCDFIMFLHVLFVLLRFVTFRAVVPVLQDVYIRCFFGWLDFLDGPEQICTTLPRPEAGNTNWWSSFCCQPSGPSSYALNRPPDHSGTC